MRSRGATSTSQRPPAASSRRLPILAAVALVLLALVVLVVRPAVEQQLADRQPLPVGGQIALPADGGLAVYDLETRRQTVLVPTPPGESVTAASWSADGKQVTYGLFHRRPGDSASVSEIYVVKADGSGSRVLAERDRPGTVLDTPVWSPDGQQVFFAYFGQSGGKTVQRIERVAVASGERQVVADDGYAPAVSPDGRSLLFLRDERSGTGVWLQPLAGGEARQVVAPGLYPALAVPRFSPDGQRFAVAIVNVTSVERTEPRLLAWLLPPAAYAHGQPWDIWTFDLDGGDPKRLSNVNADDPSPVWSPDGGYVAFWGGTGLYLVPASGGEARRVLDKGGYGPIGWIR